LRFHPGRFRWDKTKLHQAAGRIVDEHQQRAGSCTILETWMTTRPNEALKLQRPLPDGALRIVARGIKEDGAEQ
jgi:putative SOS response-associated peptidase YedK